MALTIDSCRHCGSPVPDARKDGFCCTGCAYVFQLLHEQGFERFYDLKGGQTLPPVAAQAMREVDYQWLEEAAAGQEELALSIQGLSCVGCVWLIERLFSRLPGAHRIEVDVTRGEVLLHCQPEAFSATGFARELQNFGYLLGPRRAGAAQDRDVDLDLERRAGVCGAFAMNAMAFSLPAYFGMPADFMFARWFEMVAAASATLSLLVGGSYFAVRAWRALKVGVLHIDTPITLGIGAAYLGSLGGWLAGVPGLRYFDFVAMFIFLMLGGRWLQQAAVAGNRRRLLRDPSIPDSVLVEGKAVLLDEIKEGAVFEVRPGQAVPVAAELRDASASVSLEWINGESEAQERRAGQLVPAGALNIGACTLEAAALETWRQSTLRRLLEARKPGEERDRWLEGLLRGYLAVVLALGIAGALWWWLHEGSFIKGMEVMISVFVVSCPCALGVAAPFADDIAAARAEKLGVFVRSIGLWKRLGRVRAVIFDKTGTLTLENPVLTRPESLEQLDDAQRKALRHLVCGNLHPASRSLFDAMGPGSDPHAGREVAEEPGQGLMFGDAEGRTWSLGRPGWRGTIEGADVVFALEGSPVAGFSFMDRLRGESVSEVARLVRRRLGVFILSGDREAKVASAAAQLELPRDHWMHSLTPEEKAHWMRDHHAADGLYLGDGANDSLAFDAALCAGSPVTGRSFLEHKADFYFLGHSMRFVSRLLDVAALHRRAVRRVFGFAVTYNIVTAVVGLTGHLNPLAAAVLMPLSSVATLSLVGWTFLTLETAGTREKARSDALPQPLPAE